MRTSSTLAAVLLLGTVAGCGGTAPAGTASSGASSSSPAANATTPATSAAPAPATPSAAPSPSPPPAPAPAPAPATVTIDSFEFDMPRSVPAGATVRLTNRDGESHTFTAKRAGLDVRAPLRKTVEFTAPRKPGTYDVVCTLHADMDTSLVVR